MATLETSNNIDATSDQTSNNNNANVDKDIQDDVDSVNGVKLEKKELAELSNDQQGSSNPEYDTNDNDDNNDVDDANDAEDDSNQDGPSEVPENDEEKTNLIVNYLPQPITDEDFENLFKKFGEMKSCKIVRNRSTGYSYGFGFVDFKTHEQALKAIEELNGHELDNKKIKVAFARPAGQDIKQANLYIKNVPNTWTQDDVKKIFEPYGKIIQVRVLGNDRGVAFVLFDLRKQAEDALEALNGQKVEGCDAPFEIKFAADKKVEKTGNKTKSGRRERGHRGGRNHSRNRDKLRGQNNQRSFFDRQRDNNRGQMNRGQNNQYMNASPYGGQNGVGPMRQSANRMNRYNPFVPVQQPTYAAPGSITSPYAPTPYGYPMQHQQMIPYMAVQNQTAMMPTTMNPLASTTMNQPGQPTMPMTGAPMNPYQTSSTGPMTMGAYAPSMANQTTMSNMNSMNNMSNMYNVASTTMNNAANMQPQIGQPMNMRSSTTMNFVSSHTDDGVILFVYNIGPDTNEHDLRSMFAPFGLVLRCNVPRKTPGGETKGFGFITMQNMDQANAAIKGLNGSMRLGRQLQVSLKK